MLTNGSTGQMFAVTIFAKTRKNAAIKNLLGEPGVNCLIMISTNFENLSFHDASIESIERKNDSIIVKLCGVFVSREHPWAQGKDWTFDIATLRLLGVSGEEATFWDDTKSPKVHPEPDMPLDEIMHAKFENGVFHFDGFKETIAWYEWFVTADRFELEMDVQNEKSS